MTLQKFKFDKIIEIGSTISYTQKLLLPIFKIENKTTKLQVSSNHCVIF